MTIETQKRRRIRKIKEYVGTIKTAGAVLILRKADEKVISLARDSFWYSIDTLGQYLQNEGRKLKGGALGRYLIRAGAEFVLDATNPRSVKSDLYSRLNEIEDRLTI